MGILKVNFLWARTMSELIQHDLNHLHFGIVDPGDTVLIEVNVRSDNGCCCFFRSTAQHRLSPALYYTVQEVTAAMRNVLHPLFVHEQIWLFRVVISLTSTGFTQRYLFLSQLTTNQILVLRVP